MSSSSTRESATDVNIVVIDAGVGYTLCTLDAAPSTVTSDLVTRIETEPVLYAPTIWRYELTSILTKAVHFQQLREATVWQVLQLSLDLQVHLIQPDRELVEAAFDWTLRLKRAAAYDSFYLALAERLNCELWTTDRRLTNAVAEPWLRCIGHG